MLLQRHLFNHSLSEIGLLTLHSLPTQDETVKTTQNSKNMTI